MVLSVFRRLRDPFMGGLDWLDLRIVPRYIRAGWFVERVGNKLLRQQALMAFSIALLTFRAGTSAPFHEDPESKTRVVMPMNRRP